jgi:hypothetical protein
MGDDDTEYRFVRRRRPRDTGRETPKALAEGSEDFGRKLPDGVATALVELARVRAREPGGLVRFGEPVLRVEARDGGVRVTLAGGVCIDGAPAEARRLAAALLEAAEAVDPVDPDREP